MAAAHRAGSAPQPGCTQGAEGPHVVPGAGGGGGELCETGLPFAKAYGPPLYCRACWASLGVVWFGFCVSIVSRAVQLSLFHGDALLGNSPVPWAKHNAQGPCVPQLSVPA